MFYLISFLWFVRETKAILFWLYLWQLKEYHIGRFIDHFRTEKGKQLIFNKLLIFKIFLILIFLCEFFLFGFKVLPPPVFSENLIFFFKFFIGIPFLVLILYIFEAVRSSFNFFRRKLKRPVWTLKTILLVFAVVILEIFFIITLSLYLKDEWGQINFTLGTFYLLLFDILTPLITSAVVLFFQPLAVLGRNQIIKKAKKKRESLKNLIVIGITGSYGKTSTKEFLATILSEKFKVLKTKEHQNSEMGISQCILNELKPEHRVFVVEMGAYNKGGIKLLCDIAKPKIGILTGVNQQHLATFGSMENLLSAEGGIELIESLPQEGVVIFNGNNKYCLELFQKTNTKKTKKICYSTISTAVENVLLYDLKAENVKVEKEFISFRVVSKNGDFTDFKLNLLGAQNIENILLAACCAKELGMKLEEISNACQKTKIEQSGMKLIKTKDGLNIIDSTYSANPDGVIAHLEYLKTWSATPVGKPSAPYGARKIIVMPCLIELGPASKKVHIRIGEKIGQICDLAIITTKERFKEIKEAAFAKATASQRKVEVIFIEKPKEICEKIKESTREGDIVLLEGRIPKELVDELMSL